jgi:predicted nucleotidyltransferase/uncharacterized protein (UPF0332 family)
MASKKKGKIKTAEKKEETRTVDKKLDEIHKKKLALAEKFKEEVLKKFKTVTKAVVIFGSLTRKDFSEKSDIDMLVIIDDTAARFSPEMKDRFDDELYDIAKKISPDITVQPAWTLTEFWEMARIGHPLLYTIVRDGWALYDTGFFIPIRKLLEMGMIPTTLEAVEKFMEASPKKIRRAEEVKLLIVAEDLYYAMLNSSQAVLMYIGANPPSPKHTPVDVKEHLVDTKLLEREYLDDLEDVINFRKKVEHKEVKDIKGAELDERIEKAKKFVSRMEQLLLQLQKNRKGDVIMKNYEVMIKATVAALKKMNKLPEDPKELPKAIQTHLIDSKLVTSAYSDIFKKVVMMRKLLDEEKTGEIPQKDIELTREYVRRFVRDLEPLMRKCATAKKTARKK